MWAKCGTRVSTTAVIGCALVAVGCGSGGTKATTTTSGNGPVSVSVTSPTSGSVVGSDSVTVRGTVTPATARVEINGHGAAVGGGAFAGNANLQPGQNTLNIIASASGESPGTTTLVLIRQTNVSTRTTETDRGETATSTSTTNHSSTPAATSTGSWPATSAWTVVLASVSSRGEAEGQQQRASQASLPETGVLLSTQHSSLRPGYWVAFTGVLSHGDALKRQQQARAAGFTDAYARFVSAE